MGTPVIDRAEELVVAAWTWLHAAVFETVVQPVVVWLGMLP